MEPIDTGKKYNKIAQWWHDRHQDSSYGVPQVQKALAFAGRGGKALDVGCGAGGRMIRLLEDQQFSITGLDVSEEMVSLARNNHPEHQFLNQDICTWQTDEQFDFILAWDSMFHLPLASQRPVVSTFCQLLSPGGVLIYTLGDAQGEHTDQWHNDTFYYSSIGINDNIKLLLEHGLSIVHLEIDQYPEKHVYLIATKR